MSKILIITNHSYMLYRFRLELIQTLMREHEVVLSMPFVGHEADFQAMGLRCVETQIDRRGINPATDLKLFLNYWKLLKKERPQLVITYSIKPNIYAGFACRMLGIPYCVNVQGLGTAFENKRLAPFITGLYRTALRKVRVVFFENENSAAVFREKKIVAREKQVVLKGAGINLERYAQLPFPGNEIFHFLYLGRIMREKGMDELFAAVERLSREKENRAVLDLVGFYEDEYEAQVEELERRGIVRFHAFQTEPQPYYAAADCVVLPSYHEGLSNVLLEAAASGRPLIASDIPGCREAVEDGVTGFLCRSRDTDSLYAQMCRMMELEPAQRQAMGRAGRKKMAAEFDKAAVVRQTMAALPLELLIKN